MSTTVRSYGFIAVMLQPATNPEDINESLHDSNSILRLNYEGTLVYSNLNLLLPYGERENYYGLFIGEQMLDRVAFVEEVKAQGFLIDASTIQPYNCIWYNGGDCDVDLLTLDEFKANI